jgi:hypothetical protein
VKSAIIIVLLVSILSLPARAQDLAQVEGYRVAVQRALFLNEAVRSTRPEIPGNFQDMQRGKLCTANALSGALSKSSTTYQDACEVLNNNANLTDAQTAACVTCLWLRVSPEVYGNVELRRKTGDALKNPCVYYLSAKVIKALSDRALTDRGRKKLQAEYGKDILSDVANQQNASVTFKCSNGGVMPRKVALSHGDEISILVIE